MKFDSPRYLTKEKVKEGAVIVKDNVVVAAGVIKEKGGEMLQRARSWNTSENQSSEDYDGNRSSEGASRRGRSRGPRGGA